MLKYYSLIYLKFSCFSDSRLNLFRLHYSIVRINDMARYRRDDSFAFAPHAGSAAARASRPYG